MIAYDRSKRPLVHVYRVLCALCVLAAVWGVMLALTGGFVVELGRLYIASRRPRNAFVISLFFALVVWLLSLKPDRREIFRNEWAQWQLWYASTTVWRARAGRVIATATSAVTVAIVAIIIDIYQWYLALPLWIDEEMIALNLRDRSIADLAGVLWLGQSAPFGWLVLERGVISTLGTGELALRMVPLLFGIATIGVATWVGRRWMGPIAAALFVLLCWMGSLLAHFRFEVKHYTADVFFAMLLPVLAVWATEATRSDDRAQRVWLWWSAAVVGHWVSNGAPFVTPACAIFLCVAVWRRDGARAAAWFVLGGLMWLASFALYYRYSLAYTHNNDYLQSIWITDMLPSSLGLTGSVRWFLDRLEPLALDPGGTRLWAIFWISAVFGWAIAFNRPLGVVLAGVPLSAFALASIVPLYQRLSIWMVPALYAGVTLLLDRAIGIGRNAIARRQWALLAVAAVILFAEFQLFADIVTRGRTALDDRRHSTHKHQLDDRAAVRWLMEQRRPGDVLMTTHLALPAVWWYGMIPTSDEAGSGSAHADGSPVYEVDNTDCPSQQLEEVLKNHRRVLLYLGFDVNPGLDHALLSDLALLGSMTAHREFSQRGRAAVIDLRTPASNSVMRLKRPVFAHPLPGRCVSVRRAQRW